MSHTKTIQINGHTFSHYSAQDDHGFRCNNFYIDGKFIEKGQDFYAGILQALHDANFLHEMEEALRYKNFATLKQKS